MLYNKGTSGVTRRDMRSPNAASLWLGYRRCCSGMEGVAVQGDGDCQHCVLRSRRRIPGGTTGAHQRGYSGTK